MWRPTPDASQYPSPWSLEVPLSHVPGRGSSVGEDGCLNDAQEKRENVIGEESTGNIVKRSLLMNPYRPEVPPNSEDIGFHESPPDRHVPSSSPAKWHALPVTTLLFLWWKGGEKARVWSRDSDKNVHTTRFYPAEMQTCALQEAVQMAWARMAGAKMAMDLSPTGSERWLEHSILLCTHRSRSLWLALTCDTMGGLIRLFLPRIRMLLFMFSDSSVLLLKKALTWPECLEVDGTLF